MRTPSLKKPARHPRKAFVLLTVLVVVAFLALAAYRYNDLMTAEYLASAGAHRAAQSRALAESGIFVVMGKLAAGETLPQGEQEVTLDPQSPGLTGSYEIVEYDEESSRWSINGLMDQDSTGGALKKVLEKAQSYIPDLDSTVISSIIDWLDEDDELSDQGAENQYYMALETPYRCKNGALDSMDELLLVKGVTRELLDGNGISPGLKSLFTANGRQVNYDPADATIIHPNSVDLQTLEEKMNVAFGNELLTQFVLAYRLYGGSSARVSGPTPGPSTGGGSSGGSSQSGGSRSGGSVSGGSSTRGGGSATPVATVDPMTLVKQQIDTDKQANFFRRLKKVSSIFDLAAASVSVSVQNGRQRTTVSLPSPLKDQSIAAELLPQLFTLMSTAPEPTSADEVELPARLNVNTAPPEVLALIPDLEASDIELIAGSQPASDDPSGATLAWLYTKAQVSPSKLAKVEKYLTTKPTAVRVRVSARVKGSKAASLMEATIDLGGPRPRLTGLRDLTDQATSLQSQAK